MTTIGATGRLPRGPHGLPREEVERSQRDRLLAAATRAIGENGYGATSIADILKIAGVSRTTFYQLFADKLDCFVAAARLASDLLIDAMAAELASTERLDEGPLAELDRIISVYLRTLASEPVLARVFLVEVFAAGPVALQQRRESMERFVDLIVSVLPTGEDPLGPGLDVRVATEVLAAAVSSMVTTAIGTGVPETLPAMREPIMAVVARLIEA